MKLKTLFINGIRICSHPKCKREAMDGAKLCACHAFNRMVFTPSGAKYDGMRANNGYSKLGGI